MTIKWSSSQLPGQVHLSLTHPTHNGGASLQLQFFFKTWWLYSILAFCLLYVNAKKLLSQNSNQGTTDSSQVSYLVEGFSHFLIQWLWLRRAWIVGNRDVQWNMTDFQRNDVVLKLDNNVACGTAISLICIHHVVLIFKRWLSNLQLFDEKQINNYFISSGFQLYCVHDLNFGT